MEPDWNRCRELSRVTPVWHRSLTKKPLMETGARAAHADTSLGQGQGQSQSVLFWPRSEDGLAGEASSQSPETRDYPFSERRVFIRPPRGFPNQQEPEQGERGLEPVEPC